VLSAKHGLVDPDSVLTPYDVTLTDLNRKEKREWADRVISDLEQTVGPIRGHAFEIHAGDAYAEFGLAAGLRGAGARVERPTAGMRMGRQLHFYVT
jgi:hypothetical protein